MTNLTCQHHRIEVTPGQIFLEYLLMSLNMETVGSVQETVPFKRNQEKKQKDIHTSGRPMKSNLIHSPTVGNRVDLEQ